MLTKLSLEEVYVDTWHGGRVDFLLACPKEGCDGQGRSSGHAHASRVCDQLALKLLL